MGGQAGVLLTGFEVSRDWKSADEREIRKSAKVRGLSFAEGTLWKRRCAGGPLEKLTCTWEDGVYVGTKATSREVIVENWNGVWLTRTVRVKTAKERWERRNQDVPVAVPWRKNEGDEKMDGERPEGEVVLMDKDNKEKLENTVRCRKGCTYRARTWKR